MMLEKMHHWYNTVPNRGEILNRLNAENIKAGKNHRIGDQSQTTGHVHNSLLPEGGLQQVLAQQNIHVVSFMLCGERELIFSRAPSISTLGRICYPVKCPGNKASALVDSMPGGRWTVPKPVLYLVQTCKPTSNPRCFPPSTPHPYLNQWRIHSNPRRMAARLSNSNTILLLFNRHMVLQVNNLMGLQSNIPTVLLLHLRASLCNPVSSRMDYKALPLRLVGCRLSSLTALLLDLLRADGVLQVASGSLRCTDKRDASANLLHKPHCA